MTDRYEEMELEEKHNALNMYKKVRENAGLYNNGNTNTLVDTVGNQLLIKKEILVVWKSYVEGIPEVQNKMRQFFSNDSLVKLRQRMIMLYLVCIVIWG